ncbi:hypothetical protein FRB94_011536 [Tulasnella sp. JGI-2019a]|nr:hypothetical protein FRB94_011536 [Tulasnella sp. JGI-2019a]
MAGGAPAAVDRVIAERRAKLAGPSGFKGVIHNPRVFFIALFNALGGLLYGYNQGVFSGVLVMTSFDRQFASTVNSTGLKGMVTSILELGAWVGSLLNSYTAERFGRRGAIFIACIFFILGVCLQTGAQNSGFLYGGRFITGLGVGSLSVCVPLLNAELAPAEVRGALVTLQQLSIEFGILVAFWIDYGTNVSLPPRFTLFIRLTPADADMGGTGAGQHAASWRLPLALQLVPCLILMIGIFKMPESPRWLVNQGRDDEALATLAKVRGLQTTDSLVQLEHLEVRAQKLFEQETSAEKFPDYQDGSFRSRFLLDFYGYVSILGNYQIFRRVFVGALVMFFQQWNGINIFSNLGLSGNSTNLLATGVVGIVMFFATFPTVMYLDRIGRKSVLIVGALGMAICHTFLAILSGVYEDSWPQHKVAGWWAVVFVWLYAICFGFSWGPVAWVYISEIFPLGIRAKAISVAASSNWMNNFIIGEITPTMLKHMRFGTYILFGGLTYLSAAFVYFFLPETMNVSLEEMDVVWGDDSRTSAADLARLGRIHDSIGLTRLGEIEEKSHFAHEDQHIGKPTGEVLHDNGKTE